MIYKLRTKLIKKQFTHNKESKLLSVLDKILDIYEHFKYRKQLNDLESYIGQQEKLAGEIKSIVAEYKGVKIK